MSLSTPSVVERASKEISRRMHSLGFNRSGSKSTESSAATTSSSASSTPPTSATSSPNKRLVLSESDKLNGNQVVSPDTDPVASAPAAADGSSLGASASGQELPPAGSSPLGGVAGGPGGAVLRKKPVCPAAKQPAARASMGSIIKGSVMDKVNHVFNNSVNMGNSNSSANNSSQPRKASKDSEASSAASNDSRQNSGGVGNGGSGNSTTGQGGINIPKGENCSSIFKCSSIQYYVLSGQTF